MKKLKTIKLIQKGISLSNNEMGRILGGYYDLASNINSGNPCTCSGSNDSWWWCSDNTNTATGCICSGNEDNTNKSPNCSCGSTAVA